MDQSQVGNRIRHFPARCHACRDDDEHGEHGSGDDCADDEWDHEVTSQTICPVCILPIAADAETRMPTGRVALMGTAGFLCWVHESCAVWTALAALFAEDVADFPSLN